MKPQLLSFDAAGTLVDVDWHPGRFAVQCAYELGWDIEAQMGEERYDRLLGTRWRDYCAINLTRNDALCDAFWIDLAHDWLASCGQKSANANQLVELANEGLYGPSQRTFSLFEDTLPTLDRLRAQNWRMVVLSNWDYSLHRVLRNLGIADYFEIVFASLQEGPEKPDLALFQIVCERTVTPAEAIVHIGDNPVDDFQGARQAGLKALFLDRRLAQISPPTLSSLNDLPEALEWLT